MSIRELPRATVSLLSSSQVLTTPASLVKELVDNALDAKATSIDIFITANTLDKIEVRDNGHGIASDDLNALGRRGYTSKLRDFDGLRTVCGTSLGFRGEALASAVELGDVTVTTRIEGEAVATSIKLKAHSGIKSQIPISHPVGTTVCVANIFSKLPVRKQVVLKDARKTILRIKEMLQSYALARLNVRLTFKVLKVENSDWAFAPRLNEGFRDLLAKVIGRETAAQCMEMTSMLPVPSHILHGARNPHEDAHVTINDQKNTETLPQSRFKIHAFLPKPNADLTKVVGAQFVSVDSRPISSPRGCLKKILSMYKTILSDVSIAGGSGKVKSPFIRLNIVCPLGSYDPNVEPGEDDVLFDDEKTLLSMFEDWFNTVYVDRKSTKNQDEANDIAGPRNAAESLRDNLDPSSSAKLRADIIEASGMINEGYDVIRSSASESHHECCVTRRSNSHISPGNPETSPTAYQPKFDLDMSESYPEEAELGLNTTEKASACDQSTAEGTKNKLTSDNFNQLNPWVITKLNAPISKKSTRASAPIDSRREPTATQPTATPFTFSTPGSTSISHPSSARRDLEYFGTRSCGLTATLDCSQTLIEGWLQQKGEPPRDHSMRFYNVPLSPPEKSGRLPAFDEMTSSAVDRDTGVSRLQSPPPTKVARSSEVLQKVNDPFLSPLRDAHSASPMLVKRNLKWFPSRNPQSPANADMIFSRGRPAPLYFLKGRADVHEALDFERRKEAATQRCRQEIRRSQSNEMVISTSTDVNSNISPDKDHCDVLMAASTSDLNYSLKKRADDEMPIQSCLSNDDPRAYLMRRQKCIAASLKTPRRDHKLKRAKTILLPLENIPASQELHTLCQDISTDIRLVSKALLTLAKNDQYAKCGNQTWGLTMCTADVPKVELKLRTLAKNWVQIVTGEENDIVVNLRGLQRNGTAGA